MFFSLGTDVNFTNFCVVSLFVLKFIYLVSFLEILAYNLCKAIYKSR